MEKEPLWRVEDKLTAARQKAQESDSIEARAETAQKIEEAYEMLTGEEL